MWLEVFYSHHYETVLCQIQNAIDGDTDSDIICQQLPIRLHLSKQNETDFLLLIIIFFLIHFKMF